MTIITQLETQVQTLKEALERRNDRIKTLENIIKDFIRAAEATLEYMNNVQHIRQVDVHHTRGFRYGLAEDKKTRALFLSRTEKALIYFSAIGLVLCFLATELLGLVIRLW